MLAAILKNGIVQMEETSLPKLKGNEKLVRIDYCGICGTDYQKYLSFPNIADWGHEIIGRLSDTEGNVLNRVAIRTSFPCGECKMCLSQQYFKCLAWKRAEINGYSEYIAIDEKCILLIPAQDNKLEYALIEPLYVAMNLAKKVSPNKEDIFAIIGNGTIGLLTTFYLWLNGCKNINIYARNTQGVRCQFADSLGLRTYDYNEIVKRDFQSANKIINTAPYETMSEVINNASPDTIISFNGISRNCRITLDMDTWHFKNLTICASFPHPQTNFSEAMKIVDTHSERLASLITHTFSLEETPKVFELMKSKKIDFIKVLIKAKGDSKYE